MPSEAVAGGNAVERGVGGMDDIVDEPDGVGGRGVDIGTRSGSGGVERIACNNILGACTDIIVKNDHLTRAVRQHKVVNPSTVAVAVDAVVLDIGELEGMASCRNEEGGTGPVHLAGGDDEFGIVDEEMELVVIGLG